MELLDLPPEIFQKIIANYVKSIGVSEAWKRRDVCKTFAAYISEECLGRQPMTKYTDYTARRIVYRNLGLFLEYRCKCSHGAPTSFPTLIRFVVDQFMTATGQSSEIVRTAYTEQVCNAIKGCSLNAFRRATNPRLKKIDPVEAHCLVIAVRMRDKDLVTHYLSRDLPIWEDAPRLRSPIAVAVKAQAVDILSQLLEHAKSGLTKTAKTKSNKDISRVTESAIISKHWNTASTLLDWWFEHCRKPPPQQIISWAKAAVNSRAMNFLHRLLDQDLTLATKNLLVERLYSPYYPWGDARVDLLVGALIDRNILSIGGFYHPKRPGLFYGSLLQLAAQKGNTRIAKRCLDSGASSNGSRNDYGRLEYPIVSAVAQRNKAMVKLLLAHDADPGPAHDHIMQPGHRDTGKIFKRIEELVQKAVDRKRSEVVTDT